MKKALLTVSLAALTVMFVQAQTNIQVGGTIGGTPVQFSTGGGGNGGSLIIGQQVQSNSAVGGNLINLINLVQNIVTRLVPLGIGLAVVSLFFGIIMFLWQGRESSEKREQWLKWMGYSILSLFVMVSVWGLVGFLASVLGVGVGGSASVPTIPYVAN
jgi:hypothetical protein